MTLSSSVTSLYRLLNFAEHEFSFSNFSSISLISLISDVWVVKKKKPHKIKSLQMQSQNVHLSHFFAITQVLQHYSSRNEYANYSRALNFSNWSTASNRQMGSGEIGTKNKICVHSSNASNPVQITHQQLALPLTFPHTDITKGGKWNNVCYQMSKWNIVACG